MIFAAYFAALFAFFLLPYLFGFNYFRIPQLNPYLLAQTVVTLFFVKSVLKLQFLKKEEFMKNAPYLTLPLLLLWSGHFFFYVLPIESVVVRTGFAVVISFLVALTAWGLYQRRKRSSPPLYNLIFSLYLVALFLSLGAVSLAYILTGSLPLVVVASSFVVVWLLVYFLFWLQGKSGAKALGYTLALSLIGAEISFAGTFLAATYRFLDYSPLLLIPVSAVLATLTIGYLSWGLIYHRDAGRLTRKVVYEYIAVTAFLALFFLITGLPR